MSKANEKSAPEKPVTSPAKGSTASGENGTSRKPVFFKFPMGWKEMSEEEKDRFLDEAASAIIKKAEAAGEWPERTP